MRVGEQQFNNLGPPGARCSIFSGFTIVNVLSMDGCLAEWRQPTSRFRAWTCCSTHSHHDHNFKFQVHANFMVGNFKLDINFMFEDHDILSSDSVGRPTAYVLLDVSRSQHNLFCFSSLISDKSYFSPLMFDIVLVFRSPMAAAAASWHP